MAYNKDYILRFIRNLNDRDLDLFMKYLYQNGFQDCADLKPMNSEKEIIELVQEFEKFSSDREGDSHAKSAEPSEVHNW